MPTMKTVKSCPQTHDEWSDAANIKQCQKMHSHNCKSFEYHCLMNQKEDDFLEVCAPTWYISGKLYMHPALILTITFVVSYPERMKGKVVDCAIGWIIFRSICLYYSDYPIFLAIRHNCRSHSSLEKFLHLPLFCRLGFPFLSKLSCLIVVKDTTEIWTSILLLQVSVQCLIQMKNEWLTISN